MSKTTLERLVQEVTPLIKSLSGKTPYKKYNMTFEDIEGFMVERVIKVYLKYHREKEPTDLKYLTIRSLQNFYTKILKKGSPLTISLDDPDYAYITPKQEVSSKDLLIEMFTGFIKTKMNSQDFQMFMLIHYPPSYILSRVTDPSKRIPSHLFLEFLDLPITKESIKTFNKLRRNIWATVEELGKQFSQKEGITNPL
jgi:hypothetical protein